MEQWILDLGKEQQRRVERHEAGHALIAILEKMPISGYTVPKIEVYNLLNDSRQHTEVSGGGAVNVHGPRHGADPIRMARMCMAGFAASDDKLKPKQSKNGHNSDLAKLTDICVISARELGLDVNAKVVMATLQGLHKNMRTLFTKTSPFPEALDIIDNHMKSNMHERGSYLNRDFIQSLNEAGVTHNDRKQMQGQLAEVDVQKIMRSKNRIKPLLYLQGMFARQN